MSSKSPWSAHAPDPPHRPNRGHETFPEDGPDIAPPPSKKRAVRQELHDRALKAAYSSILNQIFQLLPDFGKTEPTKTLHIWILNQIRDLEQF